MTKEVQLTQGKVALVDDEDFDLVSQHTWHARKHGKTFYAFHRDYSECTKGKDIKMHIFMTGKRGLDHADRNGLNNQRYNLREATSSEQNVNKEYSHTNVYRGVSFNTATKKFMARVQKNKVSHYGGLWDTALEAALKYDSMAYELFGEFAYLNFPDIVSA